MTTKKPTIKMVAEKAGVSRGTVDRVINKRAHVRPDVYERVMAALEETGYLSPRDIHQINLSATNPAPVKLGVILPNWTGHFKWEIQNGIELATEELRDYGIRIIVAECQTDIPDEILEKIDQMLLEGIQGISLCAMDDPRITAKINMLKEQHIPVVTYNSDLPESDRICFIGQDYTKSGRIAAELVSKCVPAGSHILAAAGNLEFNGHRTRLQGFQERIRELDFSEEQISVIETFNDYQLTYKKVTAALQENPAIQAIYMANRSVSGCIKAVEDLNRAGKLRIICHDMSDRTKTYLQSNIIDFSISQDLFQQGYQPLVCLHEFLHHGKIPPHLKLNNNISIICSQNI